MSGSGSPVHPPDWSVPLTDAPDDKGSGDLAGAARDSYAVGLRLLQHGDSAAARQGLDMAASAGSAEAIYALGAICAAEGDEDVFAV